GWVTFHPQGIHHGPHPKALAASRTKERTDEVAVMIDTKRPLVLAEQARSVEWAEYPSSWRQPAPSLH
ncbi:MAG: homogentisate 1,2-dioxygenase, partial [Cyanobacteria bacterium REEB65]|nr:homogentisate 1,2-dioxygenase [Cyanobacteria bacterium REEB65]